MDSADSSPASRILASVKQSRRAIVAALVGLALALGLGYAIGTRAAVNNLFTVWSLATGLPVTIQMLRHNDWKLPGTLPALVQFIAWVTATVFLGLFVFSEKCPLARIQPVDLPGLR